MSQQVYRVLVLGDSWANVPAGRAEQVTGLLRGHSGAPPEELQAFTAAADTVVAGMPPGRMRALQNSGIRGLRGGLLTGRRVQRLVGDLQRAGVDSLSLGTPKVTGADARPFGRLQRALAAAQISDFGAGRTREEAQQPLRIALPQAVGGGDIHIHAVGAAQVRDIVPGAPDTFRVALPCWGGDTRWRTLEQFRTAEKLLDADYDVILGHGPAVGQEVLRHRRRWVIHSMGARIGSRCGEAAESADADFHFWAMLEVAVKSGVRSVVLKLYPIVASAGGTAAVRQCDERELSDVVDSLQRQSPNGWSFQNPGRSSARDDLGWHVRLDLGPWPVGEHPQRSPGLLDEGDPDQTQPFRTYASIRQRLERFSPDRHLGSSLNAEAAESTGAEITWVSPKLALATTSARSYLIDGYMAHSSQVGAEACTDKYQTHRFLHRAGVPVPRAELVRSAQHARQAAAQIGLPVVLKPADRDRARGVSVNLSTPDDVEAAYHRARRISRRIMVEQHIDIETEMRVMASNSECVSITERILPEVWGDGFSTVEQLITERNLYRSTIFSLVGKDAPIDQAAVGRIAEQGYRLQDVPEAGSVVIVGTVGGQSSGGDIAELSHAADSTIRLTAVAAVNAIPNLRWGGVDLMIERGTGDVHVLEVNSRSGYGSATFPSYGTPKDVAGRAWQLRIQHADQSAPESTDDAAVELPHRRGMPLKQHAYWPGEDCSLAQLLFGFAEHRGYRVSRRGPRLRRVAAPNGEEEILTSRGLGPEDLAVAVRLLNRFGNLQRVVQAAGVARVRSRTVAHPGAAERVVEQFDDVLATPFSSAWGTSHTRQLRPGEADQLDFTDRWVLQEQPAGLRLRVLAFREAAAAVIATQPGPTDPPLAAAGQLAVQAVRAVPQLRWAVVDVVIPADGDDHLPQTGAVRGMSLNPRFSAEDTVISGDLDRFFRRLLGERSASAEAL